MAVGDIIAARSAVGFSFRPAAGVEIMITSVSGGNPSWIDLEDTTTSTTLTYYKDVSTTFNSKIGITNSLWLKLNKYGTYSGIQIK